MGETTWIASDKGLFELRGGEVAKQHGKKDGLPGTAVSSIAVLDSGELLVAATGGVVAGFPGLHPRRIARSYSSHITSPRV